MRMKKACWERRGTYTYIFADGTTMTLHPDRDGVTEADIKRLHVADDAEVRNNIKNARPPLTKAQKVQRRQWLADHPGQEPQKNWHLSFDSLVSTDDGAPTADWFAGYQDKSARIPYCDEESDAVLRLREIVEAATERQQQIYRLVALEGNSFAETARMLGVSDVAIRNSYMLLIKKIRNDPEMKKYFR